MLTILRVTFQKSVEREDELNQKVSILQQQLEIAKVQDMQKEEQLKKALSIVQRDRDHIAMLDSRAIKAEETLLAIKAKLKLGIQRRGSGTFTFGDSDSDTGEEKIPKINRIEQKRLVAGLRTTTSMDQLPIVIKEKLPSKD
jgi:hypothetical protein